MGYDSCMKNICKLLLSLILLRGGLFAIADEQENQPVVTAVDEVIQDEQLVTVSEGMVSDAVNSLKSISLVTHPIDVQEANCRAAAQDTAQIVDCVAKSIQYWASETSKYYSLLHKKLTGDDQTAMYRF